MILESSFANDDVLEKTRDVIEEVVLRLELVGLTLLGEAIVVVEGLGVQTMDTDGRKIRVGTPWVRKKTKRELIFDLVHEWLHVFYNHCARRGDRYPVVWNIAADIVVIAAACKMLSSDYDKWEVPKDGVQIPPWFKEEMTTEAVYDRLVKESPPPPPSQQQPSPNGDPAPKGQKGDQPQEIQSSADLLPEPLDPADVGERADEEFHRAFSEELAQAALVMEQVRKNTVKGVYGDAIHSRLQEILKGKIDWGRILRGDLISDITREFATFAPPRRRYYPEIVLPSYRSSRTRKLVLPIDVSASVGQLLLNHFIANVVAAAARAETTIVVVFDQVIREVFKCRDPRQILRAVKFMSGAHSFTSVKDVFELIRKEKPQAVACLTDGYIELPEEPYPNTHWVIPVNGHPLPWGKVHKMDISW